MTYIDGFLTPVPIGNKDAYRAFSEKVWPVFREHGALQQIECWGDDVPDGKVTDCRRAVAAQDGETVVFSWIVWPSKEARNEGSRKVMADPRLKDMDMPFDAKRLIYGGFVTIFEGKA